MNRTNPSPINGTLPQQNGTGPVLPVSHPSQTGAHAHSGTLNQYAMAVPQPLPLPAPSGAPPILGTGPRNFPTFVELFASLKRRWVLALLLGGLAAVVAAVGVWMALPAGKHQARAKIRYQVSNTPGSSHESFEREKENIMVIAFTPEFLKRVVNTNVEVQRQPLVAQAEPKTDVFEKQIALKWTTAEYLQVQMNGDDHKQMEVLLKCYVNDLKKEIIHEEEKRFSENLDRLEKDLARENERIRAIKDSNEAVLGRTGKLTPESVPYTLASLSTRLTQNQEKLNKAQSELRATKGSLDNIEDYLKNGTAPIDPIALDKEVSSDQKVMQLTQQYNIILTDLKEFRLALKEGAPKILEKEQEAAKALQLLNAERSVLQNRIMAQLRNSAVAKLKEEQRTLTAQASKSQDDLTFYSAEVEKTQREIEDVQKKATVSQANLKELQPHEERKKDLDSKISTLKSAKNSAANRVDIKEDVSVAINGNLKQKVIAATAASCIVFGCIICLIGYLEWRNRRIDGIDQVVSELGLRVIGTIPAFPSRASLKSGDAAQNQNWRFILNESVNSTRTMLLHAAKTQNMQILMVTSAMQGEGKTSLSSQLATSMATAGLRTLILDFDLRNPSMQKLFDIPLAPGCSEILLQEIDVSDAVQATTVPNLWIISAGLCNHRVVAALAQGQPLEMLFNRIRGQFDFIVVDTCPILPVADTLLVAQYVDGVVFSILQDVSQLPKVHSAVERLIQLGIPFLGTVVNGVKPDIQAYGYNYVKQLPV